MSELNKQMMYVIVIENYIGKVECLPVRQLAIGLTKYREKKLGQIRT